MIGSTLGNYRVVAKIARGGMGDVFLAEHQRIARRAAIKVLNRDVIRDPQMLARFFDEAKSTSVIKDDGIVEVYDADVDASGHAYIVMEYLQGETLASRLRRHARLPWPQACEIARQIARALDAAHRKGIVHRDLKPDNIFLVANRAAPEALTVKVLDFGIAKLVAGDPARPYRTAPGALVGTPEYMSPEQCCGIGWIDHRADVYALGCVLYKMIRGRAPFVSARVRDVIAAHMFQEPPPLDPRGTLSPRWLRALVTWMLAKQPGDRPDTMAMVEREVNPRRPFLRKTWSWVWRSVRRKASAYRQSRRRARRPSLKIRGTAPRAETAPHLH
jgi:eukaryotic-like serine/threonine-protein kinase